MFAENGTSQVETSEPDISGSGKLSERGCYGQALREGRVRQPPPGAPRTVNMLLWVFNLVVWLLVAGFMSWRLYASYLTGEA